MSHRRPLEGVRVVTVEDYLVLPHATVLLAGLGAEVIRVESDARVFSRANGPFPEGQASEDWWNHGSSYHSWYRGKQSLVLNLATPEGRAVFLRLVDRCDVLAENLRYGSFARLGLDYEALRARKPDLVVLSCTGFGHTGPWRAYGAVARTIDALSGMSFVSGAADGLPLRGNPSYMDVTGGLNIAMALLAALRRRKRTGQGCRIDLAMYESGAQCVGQAIVEAQHGLTRERMGNAHPAKAPHGCYPCAGRDQWLALSIRSDAEWQAMKEAMGRPAWADDPRFDRADGRLAHRAELDGQLGTWTAQHPAAELAARLRAAGLAAAAVQHAKDVVLDAQFRGRGFVQRIDHADPHLGPRLYPGLPYQVDGQAVELAEAPRMGEHNDAVLQGLLELPPEDIADLQARRIIASAPARRDAVGLYSPVAIDLDQQVTVGDVVEIDPAYRERLYG